MTSRPKLRRKKAPEPLDWRELAEGPALRGLAEVLATPPELARERASKRAAMDTSAADVPAAMGNSSSVRRDHVSPALPAEDLQSVGDCSTAVHTPSAVGRPTVGEIPTVVLTVAPQVLTPVVDSPSEGVTPTEWETTSVGNTSQSLAEGDLPTVIVPPTGTPAHVEIGSNEVSRLPVGETPTVGGSPTVDIRAGLPTVGFSPTEERMSRWADGAGTQYEGKRVHRVTAAQESMSLGEERVYLALWQASEGQGVVTEGTDAKLFTLGYDRIARLVRLNEKSVRLILPKLISKKVLEILAAEHSASRIGRTYRVFSPEAILERQQAANLRNIVKNGRAVEFVWPVS